MDDLHKSFGYNPVIKILDDSFPTGLAHPGPQGGVSHERHQIIGNIVDAGPIFCNPGSLKDDLVLAFET